MPITKLKDSETSDAASIESACFGTSAWGEDSIRLTSSGKGVIALVHKDPVGEMDGYVILRWVAGEAEVLRIAVLPRSRRQGIARGLLLEAIQRAAHGGVGEVFLEVRGSNTAATGFYASMGFENAGTRKGYYKNPDEDGIIMRKKIQGP